MKKIFLLILLSLTNCKNDKKNYSEKKSSTEIVHSKKIKSDTAKQIKAHTKVNIEKAKKHLYNGIWVSNKFKSILEKTKLYSEAGYYRDSPHNILFYEDNKVSVWSENEMEELYLKLNEKLIISGINGKIIDIDNSNLIIEIDGKEYSYFKIKKNFSKEDAVFEVVRMGTNKIIKQWFSGKYILSTEKRKITITFTPNNPRENFLFAWYEDYDKNIKIDIIEIYGDLYKINQVVNETYFLEQIEPFEDLADPEVVSKGIKASLTKIE